MPAEEEKGRKKIKQLFHRGTPTTNREPLQYWSFGLQGFALNKFGKKINKFEFFLFVFQLY